MKNLFAQTSFTIETTKDGSPTLRLPDSGESMHHGAGAAGETAYIYRSVIDQVQDIKPDAKTCVVGLGLGYIEICWAQHPSTRPGGLTSFEIDEGLKSAFSGWLRGSSEVRAVYDQICAALAIPEPAIKNLKEKLRLNFETNPIQADLRQHSGSVRWNTVCYDAFSSRTNQELWTYDFLDSLIKNNMATDSVLTTYACTGVLKKVTADNGFHFIKRPGFHGKRDSSLALRGLFKEYEPNFCRTF